jgi:tetratricopeptide (TPR) repeat protein
MENNMEDGKGVTRKEIEAKLAASGDYVKMDYLQACMKKTMDFDTKRFVMTRLSQIYEARMMFMEAAKLMRNVADINTSLDAKANDFLKSMALFMKAGSYDEADLSFKKALAVAAPSKKTEMRMRYKEAYKVQGKEFMKRDKRKHALDVYERLAAMDLNPVEKKEVETALLFLYERLGKIKEYQNLKSGNMPIGTPKIQRGMLGSDGEVVERPSDFDINSLFED